MCEGFFMAKVPKNPEAVSRRAVDPPPHLHSKWGDYSTDL